MARIKNCTLGFSNGSTYLLREGGMVVIRLSTGYADPYNANEVVATRLTVWCPTGNVFVAQDGDGIHPITQQIPLPLKGPYQQGSERRTVAEYAGQPGGAPVEFDIHLQGRAWAYSDEVVYFKVELLRANGTVYADNGFDVAGRKVYPQIQLRLAGSGGRTEEPGAVANPQVRALGATAILVSWDSPVEATATRLLYSTTGADGPQTEFTDAGPVGEHAWFVHEGLTPETQYHYFIQCVNSEGDSGAADYIGTAKTKEVPAAPDAPVITSLLTPNAHTLTVTFDPSAEVALADGTTAANEYRLYGRITALPDLPENYVNVKVDSSQRMATVDWLTPGESYTVYMTAFNDGGESAPTAKQAVVMPPSPSSPSAPINVQVETSAYNTQTVSWDVSNPDVVGFGLYYSADGVTWTPVQEFAPLPATARSWVQTGLAFGIMYYWRVFSFNYVDGVLTKSGAVQAQGETDPAPPLPDPIVWVGCLSLNNHTMSVFWEIPASGGPALGYKVYRSDDGVSYVFKADVPAGINYYVDRGLKPNTNYFYRVDTVGYTGDVTGGTGNAATLHSSQMVHPVCGFDLHPDSRNQIVELGGRAVITSDRDRAVVRVGTSWFKAGIRPIRGAVGLGKTTGGALSNGKYAVFLVLCRGLQTRSVPSLVSGAVEINDSSNRLVVVPPLNTAGDAVECRDWGFDIDGNIIAGADAWEIYVAEETQDQAYRVARLPLDKEFWEDTPGSGTFSIEAGLTTAALFDGTRMPMEQKLESSLPPACWIWCSKDNRVFATGEVDFKPTDAEVAAGAKLTIAAGDKHFTVSGWDASDGCVYHRLVLDEKDTGWEVYDYDFDPVDVLKVTKCYIRHGDPSVDAAGFNGTSGDYTDFVLAGTRSRVYMSAFHSGAALGQIVYSPETFPPLTIAETEFFPEDGGEILALVASGEGLLAGKPEKWVAVVGGDEVDVPLLDTRALSRGSGINAPMSVAQDANGYVYYLGDTGPFRVSAGGVEKVNVRFGGRRLFSEVYDMSSVPNAKGAWFSREDWYVVTGLNRKGKSGNRDGFVLDTRNGALLPFSLPYEATHVREYKSAAGAFQLLFGADDGRVGYLFKQGLYVDGADYTGTYALAGAVPIECELVTGVVDTEHALVPDWIQPRVKVKPRGSEFPMRFEFDDKTRSDDPAEFDVADWADFVAGDVADHVRLPSARCEQLQFRLKAKTRADMPDAYFELKELPVRVVVKHAS